MPRQPGTKPPLGWELVSLGDGPYHAVPVDDHRTHINTPGCWCGAQLDDSGVWVHKALDRRAGYEG